MAEITRKELMLALIGAGDHPHLSGLDLSNLVIPGLDLGGGNLFQANLIGADLSEARSLKGATLPDGTKHD